VIIAAVILVLGIVLIYMFYGGARTSVSSALGKPQLSVSVEINAGTGLVTVNVYNAGPVSVNLTGMSIYGTGGSSVSCTKPTPTISIPSGTGYGLTNTCTGLVSGREYVVVLDFQLPNGGTYSEQVSSVAS
jgi:hypothetical protein